MDRYRYRYIYPSIIRPPLATSASFAVFSCFRIIRSCSIWIKKSILTATLQYTVCHSLRISFGLPSCELCGDTHLSISISQETNR